MGDRKFLTDPPQTNPYVCYVFTKMWVEAIFFDGHNILTEDVFITELSSNVGISVLMTCVVYDKWSFYERCGPDNVSDFARQ